LKTAAEKSAKDVTWNMAAAQRGATQEVTRATIRTKIATAKAVTPGAAKVAARATAVGRKAATEDAVSVMVVRKAACKKPATGFVAKAAVGSKAVSQKISAEMAANAALDRKPATEKDSHEKVAAAQVDRERWRCKHCSCSNPRRVSLCEKCCVAGPMSSELIQAIAKDDGPQSLLLINALDGGAINALDVVGRSLLHLSAASGLVQVMDSVLKHSNFTAINAVSENGSTALHWAAMRSTANPVEALAAVKLLLGRADFSMKNATDMHGNTALHNAADAGDVNICAFMLSHNVDGNIRNILRQTALDRVNLRAEQHPKFAACAVELKNAHTYVSPAVKAKASVVRKLAPKAKASVVRKLAPKVQAAVVRILE
jgi:ankyrin repeat protein